MSDVPMPRDLTEREVARWLQAEYYGGPAPWPRFDGQARAVLALVEAKVRECVGVTEARCSIPRDGPPYYGSCSPGMTDDEIVARVMNKEVDRV